MKNKPTLVVNDDGTKHIECLPDYSELLTTPTQDTNKIDEIMLKHRGMTHPESGIYDCIEYSEALVKDLISLLQRVREEVLRECIEALPKIDEIRLMLDWEKSKKLQYQFISAESYVLFKYRSALENIQALSTKNLLKVVKE